MQFYPIPFPWPPMEPPNNKPQRRGNKRPGRKERNMSQPKNFMQFLREHEAQQKEYEEWLKAREKKDDKKKDERKSSPLVVGMFVFGLAQMMSLGWVYILLKVAPAIVAPQ